MTRRRRILFVDDDDNFRELVAAMLRHAGYEVTVCADGAEALERLRQSPADLIVSDVMMPRVDGLELLRRVRHTPATSTVPFVLVSARSEANDQRTGMSLGADDYVSKPFRPDDLIRTIEWRLQRSDLLQSAVRWPQFFAQALPHELNPPVRGIITSAERLQQLATDGPSAAGRDLETLGRNLRQHGSRLQQLAQDFTLWTQYELAVNRQRVGSPQAVHRHHLSGLELARLLRQCAYDCGRNPDMDIHVASADLALPVHGVERVLQHLVRNALTHSVAGTKVSVTGRVAGHEFVFQVSDHGRGMTPEQILRYQTFALGTVEPPEPLGAGLGLLLAGRLARIAGGSLQLHSNISGPGLTVRLTLPVAAAPAQRPEGALIAH